MLEINSEPVRKLAQQIALAVLADEQSEGCDLSAGMFGSELSQVVIALARLEGDNARLTRERDQALADRDLAIELLAKYRQHVEDCESIDFLGRLNDHTQSEVTFTPAEVAALLALRG